MIQRLPFSSIIIISFMTDAVVFAFKIGYIVGRRKSRKNLGMILILRLKINEGYQSHFVIKTICLAYHNDIPSIPRSEYQFNFNQSNQSWNCNVCGFRIFSESVYVILSWTYEWQMVGRCIFPKIIYTVRYERTCIIYLICKMMMWCSCHALRTLVY